MIAPKLFLFVFLEPVALSIKRVKIALKSVIFTHLSQLNKNNLRFHRKRLKEARVIFTQEA